jgi:hypothetical protein
VCGVRGVYVTSDLWDSSVFVWFDRVIMMECLCGCLQYNSWDLTRWFILSVLSVAIASTGAGFRLQVHGQNRVINSKVTTFAGSGTPGYADGLGVSAMLNTPTDIVWDAVDGTFYVCDSGNRRVRSISPSGGVPFDFYRRSPIGCIRLLC